MPPVAEVETPLGSLVRTVVARFARELRQRYGDAVHDVRLFGSFARGGAHEESDVDVAVVLDHADFDTRRKVINLATDIGLPNHLLLSPTVFDLETYERWRAQERPLVMDIEREGVAL